MGQLKFERKFSEKLNEREIEPKPGSWDELSAKLDSEGKRRNPVFWWVGMAASIVGGILILSLAFMNDPVAESNMIVDKPSEEILNESNNQTKETLIASEETEKEGVSEKTGKTAIVKKNSLQRSGSASNQVSVASLVSTKQKRNLIIEGVASGKTSEENRAGSVPEEAIAEVSSTEGKLGEVANSEVDALLAEASSRLNMSRTQDSFSEKITANDLLWDVEMELEASFREKVFEVVKEGFIKARTAVANRNN